MCNGALLADIMRDVLEGVLPLEMKWMLGQLVYTENLFTVAHFQARIDCLDLGYMEVCDRPTPKMLSYELQIVVPSSRKVCTV